MSCTPFARQNHLLDIFVTFPGKFAAKEIKRWKKTFLGCLSAVVYFDQKAGATHAVCWSKSFVFLSLMEKNKEKDRKVQKNQIFPKGLHLRVAHKR